MADKSLSHQNLIGPRNWNAAHVFSRRRWAFFLGGLVGAPALGLAIAALVTYMMPSQYLGRVRLQVQPPASSYYHPTLPPAFIQAQFQIITGKEILYAVIEELQLVKKWDEAPTRVHAYAMLLEKIELKDVGGSGQIDIEIYHTDPREAADLANAIARAYRGEAEPSRRSNLLDMLKAQAPLHEETVKDARRRMVESKKKLDNLGTATWDLPNFSGEPEMSFTRYVEAKRVYYAQDKILTDLFKAIAKSWLRPNPIQIHEPAEPSSAPARPNRRLNLLIGFLAGGVVLFLPVGIVPMYVEHTLLRP